MKADIDQTVLYSHPVEQVWAALTSSSALTAWLMPNDFKPVVGHHFSLRTRPAPGFDGIVHCQVVELEPPSRMVWTWAGGNIDTTVTFTLEAVDGGRTRLRLHQGGFHGLGAQLTRHILAGGYPRILKQLLPAYLDQATSPAVPVRPADTDCASGWRAYLGLIRRWRHVPNR